jgi:hypothetical protein
VTIDDRRSVLLLVGGCDPLSFRLRVAQSPVRADLTPSAWSHVALVDEWNKDDLAQSTTREVSLAPADGFGTRGSPSATNGIQRGRLESYMDAAQYPNVALLEVPVAIDAARESLDELQSMRTTFDVPELILRWLAYVWGVGAPASPFAEGLGVPGAAVLEAAFAARQFDLTPGLESRSSCPEAIWQTARFWHGFHGRVAKRAMSGAYSAAHDLIPDALRDRPRHSRPPQPAPPKPRAPKKTRRGTAAR